VKRLIVLVLALAAVAALAVMRGRDVAVSLFGPPSVVMAEEHTPAPNGPTFDHSQFETLLAEHVDDAGWVDYAALAGDRAALREYIQAIGQAPFDKLGRDEKLALLINAYNAFTLELILEHYDGGKLESIRDIPKDKRWEAQRWTIAGTDYSLNQIEHEQIRPKFKEPRIHWALVCAAVSCPPLRNEAYTGAQLDAQLADQERYVHSHRRWFRRVNGVTVQVTKLYDWYAGDFEQAAGSVREYLGRQNGHLARLLGRGIQFEIQWIDYDWRLNDVTNKPEGADA